jgi:cytochrome c-type biogenesis protein CcmH
MTGLIITLAIFTLVVLAFLVRPLLRRPIEQATRADFDRAVYRDQLQEVERDVTAGRIDLAEAQAARVEVQRRLLATDVMKHETAFRHASSPRLAVALVLLSAVSAAGLYLRLGDPGVPSQPFAARVIKAPVTAEATAPGHSDTKAAAERLEQKLGENPNNAEGWLLFARTQSMLGDWTKATDAYRHAIALGQNGADAFAGYGEMLVLSQQGVISPAAQNAFVAAQKTDPKNDVARFYLALADSQGGEVAKAMEAWLGLAADITDDSPMRPEIARRVAEAAKSGGLPVPPLPKGLPPAPEPVAGAGAGGPTAEQMAAATQLPPAERDKMISAMVAQLAAKLADNPNDLDGWMRLGRAYAVQGDSDKALDAYDHASKLKPDDADIKLQAAVTLISRLTPNDALPARAITLLKEAAVSRPEAPEVLWYMGIVAAREGHADQARKNWTRLLPSLTKGGEDYQMVQAALAELRAP